MFSRVDVAGSPQHLAPLPPHRVTRRAEVETGTGSLARSGHWGPPQRIHSSVVNFIFSHLNNQHTFDSAPRKSFILQHQIGDSTLGGRKLVRQAQIIRYELDPSEPRADCHQFCHQIGPRQSLQNAATAGGLFRCGPIACQVLL